MNYSTLCLPAKVYLILAITGIISSLFNKISMVYLLFSMLFIFLWTNLLNWLCNKGYMYFSWFLVLLPLISAFAAVGVYLTAHIKNV
jgi:hypothetical protein